MSIQIISHTWTGSESARIRHMSDTAERIKASDPHPSVASSRRKGTAPAIRRLKTRHPELSHAEIARKVGCHPSNVTGVLKTYLGKTTPEQLADFQSAKADVYDSLQHRLLSSLTPAKIAKARVQELVTSSAILEDKARLVRGQATGINVSVLLDVVEAIRSKPQNPPAIEG